MRRVPRDSAVTFTAVDQSVQNLAATVAPLAGGILATAVGIRPALVVAATLGVLAFAMFGVEGRGLGTRIAKAAGMIRSPTA